MERRRNHTRVVGLCDEYAKVPKARQYCQPSPHQVPWMIGPTGPTGPSGTQFANQTPSDQSMLDEYSTTNITYPFVLPAAPATIATPVSNNPYFPERFKGLTVTNSTSAGFTATVKMGYGVRTIINEQPDLTVSTYTSIALLSTGKPAILYATMSGSNIDIRMARNHALSGFGSWTETSVMTKQPPGAPMSQLLINPLGTPSFFVHVNGNFSIDYHASASINGGFDTWTSYRVYTPSPGEVTTGMVASLNGLGFPCIITTLVASGSADMTCFVPADTTWSTWNSVIIYSDSVVLYPLSLALQAGNGMALVYFDGTILRYRATITATGESGWQFRPNIVTNSNIDTTSVQLFIIESTGMPAVFYKVTGVDGVTLAINSANDGSGAWTLYTILPDLTSFASAKQTLFPINLENGNIGLLYASPEGLMFGVASPNDPETWETHLVDDVLADTGYYPHGVLLQDGYPSIAYTSYGSTTTVIFGKSAIKNDVRFLDETDFTINWVVPSS